MKRIGIIGFFLPVAILLSGCELSLTSLGVSQEKPPTEGLYRSEDGGETWTYLSDDPIIPPRPASALALDPAVPPVVYFAAESVGLYKSWDRGESWESLNRGMPVNTAATIRDIIFGPEDNNTIYLVGDFDQVGRVMVGDNGGEDWRFLYTDLPGNRNLNSMVFDPNRPERIYAVGDSEAFLVSDDVGETWRVNYWFSRKLTSVAINPTNPDRIWVIVERSGLYLSEDEGISWVRAGEGVLPRRLNEIAFNDDRPESIYLATDTGVYFSADGVNDWMWLTEGLPASTQVVNAIAFHPTDPEILYLVIERNLYITYNHGGSWEIKQLPVPNEAIELSVDALDPDVIYAGVL